jgi:colanic acid/amylovoran biosynthesis protein
MSRLPRAERRPLRVLVEPGSYRCENMGDVAMLQVGVARLRRVFPDSQVHVVTSEPTRLQAFCPDALPAAADGRQPWIEEGYLTRDYRRVLPTALYRRMAASEGAVTRRWPTLYAAAAGAHRGRRGVARVRGFLDLMRRTDLFVVAGQGSMGDWTSQHAHTVLGTLALARRHGIPTAMLGQGIGPLTEPALVERARAVLPQVGLIALRERVASPTLLTGIGVPAARVHVTGDDAIELARLGRGEQRGGGLGVNVRVSVNAGLTEDAVAPLREMLASFVRDHGGPPLVGLPIARGVARDAALIRQLCEGVGDVGDGGATLDTPTQVIDAAARCRVVVTGAYHAAVFALSQGVPTVCLSGSPYYDAKFVGLAELFGEGCRMVRVQEGMTAVRAAADALWRDADRLRGRLRDAALSQIVCGRATAARLAGLLPAGG